MFTLIGWSLAALFAFLTYRHVLSTKTGRLAWRVVRSPRVPFVKKLWAITLVVTLPLAGSVLWLVDAPRALLGGGRKQLPH